MDEQFEPIVAMLNGFREYIKNVIIRERSSAG